MLVTVVVVMESNAGSGERKEAVERSLGIAAPPTAVAKAMGSGVIVVESAVGAQLSQLPQLPYGLEPDRRTLRSPTRASRFYPSSVLELGDGNANPTTQIAG